MITIKGIIIRITFYLVLIGVILQASYFALNYLPEKNKIVSAIATQLLQQPVQIQTVSFEGSIFEPIVSLQNATLVGIQLRQLQVIIDVWESIDRHAFMTKKFVIENVKLRLDQNTQLIIHHVFLNGTRKSDGYDIRADCRDARIEQGSARFALKNCYADMHVTAQGLTLTTRNITIDNMLVRSLDARLPSFSHPVLFVHAEMETNLAYGLSSLQKTVIAQQFSGVTAKGPVHCDLQLQLPLYDEKMKPSAQGKIIFNHDHVSFPKWDVHLSKLTGELEFHDDYFVAKNLHAIVLEQPIWMSLESQKNKYDEKSIRASVRGDLNPASLSRHIDFLFLKEIPDKIPFAANTILKLSSSQPYSIAVSLGDFHLWNQVWRHLTLNIKPISEGLSIQLHNLEIAGNVFLPTEKKLPIRADLNYVFLTIPKNTVNHSAKTRPLNPSVIPPLDLSIRHLYVNHESNGKINLILRPIQNGIAIRALKIHSPLLQMHATGEWVAHDDQMQTALTGQAESQNLGKFLSQHRLSSRLKGGVLLSDFSLRWMGTPQQFSLVNALGKAHITVRDGRIMQLDSDTETNLTLGRLLNLFSLESVSRFLTFDFLSLTKKGFPFEVLQGKFEMARGAIFARDTEIDSSVAKINLNGKISLADQSSDFKMSVFPKISSSVPMLAGIAGGPVVGAVAWVANKIVAPRVGEMMEMDYHISGTLDKPIVKRIYL